MARADAMRCLATRCQENLPRWPDGSFCGVCVFFSPELCVYGRVPLRAGTVMLDQGRIQTQRNSNGSGGVCFRGSCRMFAPCRGTGMSEQVTSAFLPHRFGFKPRRLVGTGKALNITFPAEVRKTSL